MEKNSLEKIVAAIKSLDTENYSANTEKELYSTYNKFGEKVALDLAINILEGKSESILTLDNLKSTSGTAKIINYLNMYNEIKAMRASYNNKEDNSGKNWIHYLMSHGR